MLQLLGLLLLVPVGLILVQQEQWLGLGLLGLAFVAVAIDAARRQREVRVREGRPGEVQGPTATGGGGSTAEQPPPDASAAAQPPPPATSIADERPTASPDDEFESIIAEATADPSLLRRRPETSGKGPDLPVRRGPAGDGAVTGPELFIEQTRTMMETKEGDPAVLVIELDGMRDIQTVLGDDRTPMVVAAATSRVRDVAADWPVGSLADDRLCVAMMTRPFLPAHHLARSIRSSLARPMAVDGVEFRLASSVGIAQGQEDPDVLMRRATVAAQNASRLNTGVERHTITNPTEVRRRLLVAAALSDALEAPAARKFGVAFQPIVTPLGELAKAEALARWEDPKVGPVAQSEFVPLAERTGLIDPMLDIVMRGAITGCTEWRAAGIDADVSVNLSPINLRKPLLVSELTAAIEASDLDPGHVTLEITETAVIDDGLNAIRILRDLRAAGFIIAIDDFGVGESSLSRLQDLPVSIVKLDGSFSRKLTTDRRSSAIIRATVEVCRALDMTVIAEGIETGEQADVAAEIGVHLLQGFLFATALTVEDVIGDGGHPERVG